MNKYLFHITFAAVVVKSMLFMLSWPDVVLLIALLAHFGYEKYVELKKNKEDINVLQRKIEESQNKTESQIHNLVQQFNEVKNKVNFTLKR
jgi:hypothetical protein